MREMRIRMSGFCVKIFLFWFQRRTLGQPATQKRLLMQSYMDLASFLKLLSEVSKSLKMRQLYPHEDSTAPVEGSMSKATHVVPPHEDNGPVPSILENEVVNETEARRERSRSPVPERAAASSSRRVSVEEPEAERTPTRRSTRDTTDDLPIQIRDEFTRSRESESPTVQSYIGGSRQKERKKHGDFQDAIPPKGKELSDLLEAADVPIPSKWVDTIKNIHEKHRPDYVPEFKLRLVSCGSFEDGEGVRIDAPTSDMKTRTSCSACRVPVYRFVRRTSKTHISRRCQSTA